MKTGIDVHCHLTHMENPEEVTRKSMETLSAVVTATAEIGHAEQALQLREEFPGFAFASLGLHPEYCGRYSRKEIEDYMEFIRQNRKQIVAIGEVGLDYSWLPKKEDQEKSKEIFLQMIELAKKLSLPLEIHARNSDTQKTAISDALRMLTDADAKDVIMHCFSGSEEEMAYAIGNGYCISFATIICRSRKHQRLASKCPLDSMLLETDSPWLDPDKPAHGARQAVSGLTNRPWKIQQSAQLIAGIKDVTEEEVLQKTEENARKIFNI